MYNPSLRQEPRYEPAAVIPLKQEHSLLDWLQSNDRIISREIEEQENNTQEEEISELMEIDEVDEAYNSEDESNVAN